MRPPDSIDSGAAIARKDLVEGLEDQFNADGAVRAGVRVSWVSVVWTVLAGAAAIAIGLRNNSLVLIAFGGLSAMDAAGSSALIVHFRHALRHESVSARHEKIALTIITVGMAILGLATMTEGVIRLLGHSTSHSDFAGIGLAGVSLVALGALSIAKRRISARIPSLALRSDSWLSAIGAVLALVTLCSTALVETLGWWWIDPVGSLIVGAGAVALGRILSRGEGSSVGHESTS